MSVVEDVRKVVQDMVAPDLRALSVRVDELEKRMNLRFDHADNRVTQLEKRMEEGFKQIEAMAQSRHEMLLSKLEYFAAVNAANHQALMHAVDLDRRIERIELSLPARAGEGGRS